MDRQTPINAKTFMRPNIAPKRKTTQVAPNEVDPT